MRLTTRVYGIKLKVMTASVHVFPVISNNTYMYVRRLWFSADIKYLFGTLITMLTVLWLAHTHPHNYGLLLWALFWGVPWHYIIARTPALTPSINISVWQHFALWASSGTATTSTLTQTGRSVCLCQCTSWCCAWRSPKGETLLNTYIDRGSKGRSPSYYIELRFTFVYYWLTDRWTTNCLAC